MLLPYAKRWGFLFCSLLSIFSFAHGSQPGLNKKNYLKIYPDFEESMMRHGKSKIRYLHLYRKKFEHEDYFLFKRQAKKLYNIQRRKDFSNKKKNVIPHIVHHIWLGSPLPERFKKMMETWQKWDDWVYLLWTDEDVKNLHLQNQALYDSATNYGEKADILRLELLDQFGGLYTDVDFECLDPDFFNFANDQYDFYIGFEPLECHPSSCCNAIMAASPGHPMIKTLISELENHVKQLPLESTVEERTGPRYVSKMIFNHLEFLKSGIIFPPTFFYPIMKREFEAYAKNKKNFLHRETVAVHFMTGSWR